MDASMNSRSIALHNFALKEVCGFLPLANGAVALPQYTVLT